LRGRRPRPPGFSRSAIAAKRTLRLAFAVRLITGLAVLPAREIRGLAAIPQSGPGAPRRDGDPDACASGGVRRSGLNALR
jgi:hypothetical protein